MDLLCLCISLSLTVLPARVLAQTPVPINFQSDVVQVQTGSEILFIVIKSDVFSMSWTYETVETLGLWTQTGPNYNSVLQFQGRLTISATQLRIRAAQLNDTGFYTVEVVPTASTNLAKNSRKVQLKVFDPVVGISLTIPSVAVEGKNMSLSCTWTGGTQVTTQWGKDGTTITPGSRISLSGGSLVINPVSRNDTGEYTCTASNNVSAQTSAKSVTVYYGPDTPVLTVDSPKKCVGGGDVLVGQTARLTCKSASLPPATFKWERDGQTLPAGAPESGVLSLQTFSTNDSGRYVCTAANSITAGTAAQGSDLAIVDVCLDGGEVAGIVIGAFLGLLIIVLLILFLIVYVRRRREGEQHRNIVFAQKTDPTQRPLPPDPQTNGIRNLDQGLWPPLHQTNRQPERLIANNLESRANPQTLPVSGGRDFDMWRNNSHTNPLPQNTAPNFPSYRDDGFNNPAFTRTMDGHLQRNIPQQQNPNVLIQALPGQGENQRPAVQVSLNALPNSRNPNNAQMPTINVNLNSYPGNQQQAAQGGNQAFNDVPQTLNNLPDTRQSNDVTQNSRSRLNGHVNPNFQVEAALVPSGHSHLNNNLTSQRNENTQTYPQNGEMHPTQDRAAGPRESRSRERQNPWDRLRGTPAYPSGTSPKAPTQPEADSDYSGEYTINPTIRPGRTVNRAPPQTQTSTRRRTPPRRDPPSEESQTYAADHRHHSDSNVLPAHSHRSPQTGRENAQPHIRGHQSALRQETTGSNNPQAPALMSQRISAGHSAAVTPGPRTQPGLTAQDTDTRALADPNHLQQNNTQPGQSVHMHAAFQPRQRDANPVPAPAVQPNPSNLTQAAVRSHTERAQVFQNRRRQTQAALIQTPAPAAGGQPPPPPPPPMALAQFQSLPKTHHRSPTRVPGLVRHDLAAAQRHHAGARPAHRQHGHVHAGAHRRGHVHARGHGHPANGAAWQQQAHRGRPR